MHFHAGCVTWHTPPDQAAMRTEELGAWGHAVHPSSCGIAEGADQGIRLRGLWAANHGDLGGSLA